ncbi:unnamed protein product [Clavelina lepadiformis]|uniref:Uncharacterized protein n=1 Tax=Clavelina lepadiformis TaxID=159417 RepID=A0ABP0F3C6_CLALP
MDAARVEVGRRWRKIYRDLKPKAFRHTGRHLMKTWTRSSVLQSCQKGEKKSIERESEEEKEEAAGQEVSERKEDEMVVDERESHGLEGEAEHSGAEEVPGKKRHHRRKAKYCSRLNRTVRFSWTACFRNFSLFLQSVYGGEKRLADAEKQKYILQRIVSNCSFEDLHAFSLDTYIEKHVKLLEEGKCKPSTFIAHNAAIVAFIKFLTMRHAAECSFDYQPINQFFATSGQLQPSLHLFFRKLLCSFMGKIISNFFSVEPDKIVQPFDSSASSGESILLE